MDYEMTLERTPDPKGDRVKLVRHGKFLPIASTDGAAGSPGRLACQRASVVGI
ncbi:MAG: hypothetical protein ACJ79O_21375 [Myxococcales bacterium]